jgi:hypothetical protein
MPELIRSQAHTILNYLKFNKEAVAFQPHGTINNKNQVESQNLDPTATTEHAALVNRLMYSKWNPATFQANKPTQFLYNSEFYSWLTKNNSHHRALQSHRSVLDNTLKLVDNKFFKKNLQGDILNYQPCITKFFPVGKLVNLS